MKKKEKEHHRHVPYSRKKKKTLQLIYIVSAIIWIFLIYALGVFNFPFSWIHIVLCLPLFIYAIGFLQVCKTTQDIEDDMFSHDFLALGLLFVTVFIRWSKSSTGDNGGKHTLYITLAAFTLIILSTIDVWIKKSAFSIVKHIRSIFQTAGVALLVYLLYFYFGGMLQNKVDEISKSTTLSDSPESLQHVHPLS